MSRADCDAAALIVASVVPIYLAQRLSSDVGAH
ncbi:hypothetical protein HD593_008852 [Nonomuraea rubra]|uniref:Uncharacterized protein n=1 Tax=Nonomuraea rubra TaxID=46180 RepID=A0A7X0U3M3_9ACTN|nr:hypothetical protein [Nonomuraea rubra]